MVNNALATLIKTVETAFMGRSWYGISATKTLAVLHWQHINLKPSGTTNSIAIILGHMISWRIFAFEKIAGNVDFDIAIDSEVNWPDIIINSEKGWGGLLIEFQQTHERLMQTVIPREDNFLKKHSSEKGLQFPFFDLWSF